MPWVPSSRSSGDHAGSSCSDDDDDRGLLMEYPPSSLQPAQARSFFVSHALSTWNARIYEFAAVIFTASAFPDSLAMSSLRGLVTTAAALLCSSAIGRSIDEAPDRLKPLMSSILVNRVSIVAACGAWYVLFLLNTQHSNYYSASRLAVFGIALLCGIAEKLSGIGNMLASERDWVPVLADGSDPYTLSNLNAICRRIDLICKLLAPVAISWIISVSSVRTGILVVASLSAFSCALEIWNALHVWRATDKLRIAKTNSKARDILSDGDVFWSRLTRAVLAQVESVRFYFSSSVWIPSLALAVLYVSALSYAATLTTYLLNTGFSLIMVTVARTFGSIIEVSSTYVAPMGIRRLVGAKHHAHEDAMINQRCVQVAEEEQGESDKAKHLVGVQRSGLWGLTLQWATLIPVVIALWRLEKMREEPEPDSSVVDRIIRGLSPSFSWVATSIIMFTFLSVSRMGLWVFDLAVQELTQTEIRAAKRSSFAGTEAAFVNFFELSQWIAALAFPRIDQFKWLALGSLFAVTCSLLAYGSWVRVQRGHLFHLERFARGARWAKP